MASDVPLGVIVTWLLRDNKDGTFWIDIDVDGSHYGSVGPFDTEEARDKAHDDCVAMLRSQGAVDIPLTPQ